MDYATGKTYFNGVAVPRVWIDSFSGTSDGSGYCDLTLTFTPTSKEDCIPVLTNTGVRWLQTISLTGKTLRVAVVRGTYYRSATTTNWQNTGAAGADPHQHTIAEGLSDLGVAVHAAFAYQIVVSYPVARP